MVGIYLNMEKRQLMIDGHADSAEPGKDLVCCAVSILAESLSRYMDAQEGNSGLKYLINEIEPGRTYISAVPSEWCEKEIQGAFGMTREGLRALAEEYPEYIRLEEV